MKPRTWKDLIWPGAEKDSAFRAEIDRLSVVGLRVIAAVSVGANLFAYFLFLLWLPSIPEWMAASDLVTVFLVGVGVALTFWSKALPHARWLCLGILGATAAVQIVTMLDVSDLPVDNRSIVPAFLAITLLLTVSVLPVKPIHAFVLGSSITALFFWKSFGRTRYVDLSFEEAFPVSIMLIVVLVATALTAVMYRQRFEAFEARRAAEEAFDALEEAQGRLLISANATSQNRLAAALAHELNTPLGALSSALGTLTSAFSKQSTVDSRLQEVVAGAADAGGRSLKRLSETVERMKRVTNLDRAELQRVDLNQLWRDTVILLDDELAPRVRFEMQLEPVPLIEARPQQLAAVFSNLVRNTAAAITASGRDGTIRVSMSSSGKEIVMEVTDDGEGIADEALPRLFEPTFRAERGRVGTANWGLFTSRGIVTAHGGHIEIESELGRGTAARIRLPAQRE